MVIIDLPINYENSDFATRRLAREKYIESQNGKCYYCGKLLYKDPSKKVLRAKINPKLFPKGMFKFDVHLHHNRKTGMTIGAVHSRCNAYLWQYKGE